MPCTQPARPSKKASSRRRRGAHPLREGCSTKLIKTLEGDEKIGVQHHPPRHRRAAAQIVSNAGEEGAVVIGKIHESKDSNFGYNARTGEYEDLVKAGVIDPTKVTRTALQNAASIAGLMLTTEAMIAEIPEKKEAAGGGQPRRRRYGLNAAKNKSSGKFPGVPCNVFRVRRLEEHWYTTVFYTGTNWNYCAT
jgi:hypothetical protein